MFSAMFFRKNLPMWERVIRTVVGLGVTALPFVVPVAPELLKWLLIASGISFVAMGFVGFCPMCAMVGRRPVESSRKSL